MNLQPLRIEAGWQVTYNQLYEVDPLPGNESYFEGSSLLMLRNDARLKLIDVEWRPEKDLNGSYNLKVLKFLENFNSDQNRFKTDPDWESPFLTFSTRSRIDLVTKLEELMRTLLICNDPRILSKRGVVSQPSESYRLDMLDNGLSDRLIDEILNQGNPQIQNLLLDHHSITRDIILKFVEQGRTQKVKNKAAQKLQSKKFRQQ
jgi:hypothetical protein